MTRQNVTDGPREILTKKCPTCAGDGIVVSEATAAMEVERRLRQLAAGSRAQAFSVEVSPRTLSLLVGPGATRLAEIEEASKKRFFLVAKEGVHADHAAVLAEGKLEDLRPEAPVEEGKRIELKLVELGLHDAHAAVGKLDGHDVVVGAAAKLVGKKAKVRIERVFDGIAYATLLSGGDSAPEPITFESEAEKPTRAPSRAKKVAEDAVAEEPAEAETEPDLEAGVAELEAEETEVEEIDADETTPADGTPKKKTRRGSRGGRNRKKKPVTDADAAELESVIAADDDIAPDEPVEEAPAEERAAPKRRAPRIHVPTVDLGEPAPKPARSRAKATAPEPAVAAELEVDAELAGEAEPESLDSETGEPKPKKKTRRGSRGGRNRKRKPAADAAAENGAEPTAEAEAELEPEPAPELEPAPDGNGRAEEQQADDYVPMSEWLDDIESADRR